MIIGPLCSTNRFWLSDCLEEILLNIWTSVLILRERSNSILEVKMYSHGKVLLGTGVTSCNIFINQLKSITNVISKNVDHPFLLQNQWKWFNAPGSRNTNNCSVMYTTTWYWIQTKLRSIVSFLVSDPQNCPLNYGYLAYLKCNQSKSILLDLW